VCGCGWVGGWVRERECVVCDSEGVRVCETESVWSLSMFLQSRYRDAHEHGLFTLHCDRGRTPQSRHIRMPMNSLFVCV